jgi:transglutaminase-like putative cysteine protease
MARTGARQGSGDPETGGYRLEIPGMIELGERFIRWSIRLIGGQTLLHLLLLSLMFLCVERGLVAVVGHIRPVWLASTAVTGVLLGWLLGRSRLPGWGCILAAAVIGPLWLLLSVGQMSLPLDIVLRSLPPIFKQYLFHLPLNFGTLNIAWSALAQEMGDLSNRLIVWFRNFGTSTLVIDPGVTSLIWGLALWLVANWAAWWIRRREAMGIGLLPATILLVYNVYYTNSVFGIVWLVFIGGGWIFLQAMESYAKGRQRWRERHMGQTDIEVPMGLAVLLVAGVLMLAGGLLPSLSIQKISDAFQQLFESPADKNLAESLGLEQTPITIPQSGVSGVSLSTTHAVGPGPHLTQEVVMWVTVDGYVPPPPPEVLLHSAITYPEVRYYWRSQTYDYYNGHVWVASTSWTQDFTAGQAYLPDLADLPANYTLVRQHVQRLQPMEGALFAAGSLLSADQPSTATWRASGDLIYARTEADIYTADSRIQSVTVDQLRRAGRNYPDALERYLRVPDELPERVRDLAVSLTIDQPTPYDQVTAIQTYLRQFPYSLDVPGSPANRDVADYFLFDLQKGYCDYFATTMAVLVRSTGIPARLVTGFSNGTYDYALGHFVVVQASAHAWVEVYFPGLGWVEFEPTTNMSPFPRLGENPAENISAAGVPTPAPPVSGRPPLTWNQVRGPLQAAGLILAALIVLLLLWRILPWETWLLNLRSPEKAIPAIHRRLYRLGHAWGVPANAARTPHEFARAFVASLENITTNPRLAPTVASVQADVQGLTGIYTRLLFSPIPPTPQDHRQAVNTLANIRRGLRRIRYS